jgi:hypothetical protein
MSQYQSPFEQQTMERPRTSGLAITAFVLSLVAIIPCLGLLLAPIGVILGLVGVVTVAGSPARKGAGLAVAAIVIGAIVFGGQLWGGYMLWQTIVGPVMRGPNDALVAGFAGDIAGFKSHFHGEGAAADDATAKAFIDELRARYGEYQSCTPDNARGAQPSYGQPSQVIPYTLQFKNGSVSAEAEMIFADESTGQIFIMKWGYIKILDPERGDLRYPPAAEKAEKQPAGEEAAEQPAGEQKDEATEEAEGHEG